MCRLTGRWLIIISVVAMFSGVGTSFAFGSEPGRAHASAAQRSSSHCRARRRCPRVGGRVRSACAWQQSCRSWPPSSSTPTWDTRAHRAPDGRFSPMRFTSPPLSPGGSGPASRARGVRRGDERGARRSRLAFGAVGEDRCWDAGPRWDPRDSEQRELYRSSFAARPLVSDSP